MVCREYAIGSAMTSFARLRAGLEDQQTLSAYHDLLREGRGVARPTQDMIRELVDEQIAAVQADTVLSEARRRSLIARLETARERDMPGNYYYASRAIMERTASARIALDNYADSAARDLGVSRAQIEADLASGIVEAGRGGRGQAAPREWREQFASAISNRSLPLDRQTAYAIHRIEQRRAAARVAAPSRRTVTRQPVNSSAVASVGYDPATGRLEVEVHSRPGHGYAYRVPQHVYDEMMASTSIGSYYSRNIRGQRAYQYSTAAEHEAAANLTQCRTCGQFAGDGHACPPRDSVEERNRTERLAREAARATASRIRPGANAAPAAASNDAPGTPAWREARIASYVADGMNRSDALDAVIAEEVVAQRQARIDRAVEEGRISARRGRVLHAEASGVPAEDGDLNGAEDGGDPDNCPDCGQFMNDGHNCQSTVTPAVVNANSMPRESHRMGYASARTYQGRSGAFQTPNLTTVQQEARNRGRVNMRVASTILRVAGVDGMAQDVSRANVNGRVEVEYLGRGRGYRATAVTEPGDSGVDRLQCNCADYRARYDCVHVRQTVQDINTRINQERLRDRHAIGEAVSVVGADLAQDRAESIAAQETSIATWGEPEVVYADDMAAFQADYRAAKERRERGEPAVEYMLENATDGLGARGTGRAFGVEIEFDIGPNVDRHTALAAIGREMHAAGLTSSASQRGYHSGMSRGYTENHRGGWSYEQDCTVHGEIVSPIMYDEPETWQNLQKVCEIVKRNGGVATIRTGGHVHVSTANYDHTVANHTRLMATWRENEDLIYRLSSSPDRGTHRGPQWCAPNRVPSSGYRDVSDARSNNYGHNLGVNMQSVSGRASDHVEFRTYDQTLDPGVIQTQIKMSLALTEAAFRDTDSTPTGSEPLGSHRANNRAEHGASRRLTGDAWKADTESFRKLVDKMYRRRADKAQAASLFAVTKWQRGR